VRRWITPNGWLVREKEACERNDQDYGATEKGSDQAIGSSYGNRAFHSPTHLTHLLKPHVSKLVVCDPRRNALLKEGNQNDLGPRVKRRQSRQNSTFCRELAAVGGDRRGYAVILR